MISLWSSRRPLLRLLPRRAGLSRTPLLRLTLKPDTKVTSPDINGDGNMFELQLLSELRHYPETPYFRVERFQLEKKNYESLSFLLGCLNKTPGQEFTKPKIFNPFSDPNQREVRPDVMVLFGDQPDPDQLTAWLRSQCTQFKDNSGEGPAARFVAPSPTTAVIGEITQSGGAHLAYKLFQVEKALAGLQDGSVADSAPGLSLCLACVFLNSTVDDFEKAKKLLPQIMSTLESKIKTNSNMHCHILDLYRSGRLVIFYTPYRNIYAVIDNLKDDMDKKFEDAKKDTDKKFENAKRDTDKNFKNARRDNLLMLVLIVGLQFWTIWSIR